MMEEGQWRLYLLLEWFLYSTQEEGSVAAFVRYTVKKLTTVNIKEQHSVLWKVTVTIAWKCNVLFEYETSVRFKDLP